MTKLLPEKKSQIIIEDIIREVFKKKGVDKNVFRTGNKKTNN